MSIVVEIQPLSPAAGARVPLRFASGDDSRLTSLGGLRWWPGIVTSPSLSMEGWDGDFSTPATLASASLGIDPRALRKADPASPGYRWPGAPVRIYEGAAGTTLDLWKLQFAGLLTDYSTDAQGRYAFTAQVDGEPFEAVVLKATYAGTGGAEGGDDLKGKVKPMLLGFARNVEPVLVDAVNNVFQVHGYGSIQAIDAVYERAADFVENGGINVGDFPTYAALVAAVIAEGNFGTCLARGMFRLGAPPAGLITADVSGDNGAGFARSTSAVVRRLCALAGVATDRLDAASLDALDAATPAGGTRTFAQMPINLYLTGQAKLIDVVQSLMRPCNAQALVSWTGQLRVVRFGAIPAPAFTLDAQGRARPAVLSSQELKTSPPYHRIEMRGARAWRPQSKDEISFTAPFVSLGNYDPTTTYREGNLVQYQGSTWLYTAIVATAGRTPPTLPIESDAYWSVWARAGADGIDGRDGLNGSNGTPGAPGANGQTTYLHTAYSDAADGSTNFTTGAPGPRKYLGVLVDFAPADSESFAAYTWSLIKGADGLDGANGIPGAPGANGQPTYVHIAYSNAVDGSIGFSVDDPAGRTYVGFYVDQVVADSTNPALYSWSLVKGADGANGLNGSNGAPGATGANGQTSYVHYAYANSPDGTVDFDVNQPNGRAYEGSYTDFTAADSANPTAYVWREYKGPPFGLAARGNAVVAGSSIIKNGGVSAWDSDAFSTVGFRNGAVSAVMFGAGSHAAAGLNTDPTASLGIDTIDFAWHVTVGGAVYIIEDGQIVAQPFTSWTDLQVFQVHYDGQKIRYYVGEYGPYREVTVGPGKTFYFDSSLWAPGSRVNVQAFSSAGFAGTDGRDGLNGSNGTPGAPGANGQTSYLHTAYADSLDGSVNFTTGAPGTRKYLGILVDFTVADSGSYTAYTWSLIKGSDGLNGSNGSPGAPGANGQPTYVHIAYSNAVDGSVNFSTSDPAGRTYVGFYVDQLVPDSTNPALYSWSLVKGTDGANGTPGSNGAPGAAGIPGAQGPAGVSAPQPVVITGNGSALAPILLQPGQTLNIEAGVGVQVGNQAGTVTLQILVAVGGGGYNVAGSGTTYVGPGEPGTADATASVTNSTSSKMFAQIQVGLSGPNGFTVRPETTNYLRAM